MPPSCPCPCPVGLWRSPASPAPRRGTRPESPSEVPASPLTQHTRKEEGGHPRLRPRCADSAPLLWLPVRAQQGAQLLSLCLLPALCSHTFWLLQRAKFTRRPRMDLRVRAGGLPWHPTARSSPPPRPSARCLQLRGGGRSPGWRGRALAVCSAPPTDPRGVSLSEELHAPPPPHPSFSVCLAAVRETPAKCTGSCGLGRGTCGTTSRRPLSSQQPWGAAFLLRSLPGNAELPAKLAAQAWLRTHL